MNKRTARFIASKIWEEEQRLFYESLKKNPTDSHLNGVLRGLQIARTIIEELGE